MAVWTQGVNFACFDNGGRSGASLLPWGERPIGVDDLVGIGPQRLARSFLEAKDTLLGLRAHQLGIGEVDPPLGNHRTRPSRPNWNTPAKLQSIRRKRNQSPSFGPHAVSVRTSPLWPI